MNIIDVYKLHRSSMTTLVCSIILTYCGISNESQVFNDGASYRGRLKTKARDIVEIFYADALRPSVMECNSDQYQQMVAKNVKSLLDDSSFLLAPELDDQVIPFITLYNTLITVNKGRSSNFAHPAIIELCKKFYYGGKSDSLATLFPEEFNLLPLGCLAMACTAVSFHPFIVVTL